MLDGFQTQTGGHIVRPPAAKFSQPTRALYFKARGFDGFLHCGTPSIPLLHAPDTHDPFRAASRYRRRRLSSARNISKAA
jgi:hypothetical protein